MKKKLGEKKKRSLFAEGFRVSGGGKKKIMADFVEKRFQERSEYLLKPSILTWGGRNFSSGKKKKLENREGRKKKTRHPGSKKKKNFVVKGRD